VGDAAHGGGAQIHIGLRLDLAGAADDCGQVLLYDFGGQNLGVAGLLMVDEQKHESGGNQYGESNQEYLFHVRFVLQTSPDSVYAILFGTVPCRRPIRLRRLPCRPVAVCGKRLEFRRREPSGGTGAAESAKSTEAAENPAKDADRELGLSLGRLNGLAGRKTSSQERLPRRGSFSGYI
jgi:hypothetical protein